MVNYKKLPTHANPHYSYLSSWGVEGVRGGPGGAE